MEFLNEPTYKNEKVLIHFLRNYDIHRVKEERMYQSFRIGRKIHHKENTDGKINTEIENAVLGVCMRKPKENDTSKKKAKQKPVPVHFSPKDEVFGSLDIKRRSDAYYHKFASDSLDNDMEKELK
jgi:hypothetical protein